LFLAPAAALLVLFAYWPLLDALRLALYRSNGLGLEQYVGLGNFRQVLGDPLFWESFVVLLKFAVLGIPLGVIGPLIGARLVHGVRNAGLASLYRLLLVLPVMVPMVVSVLIWRNLYGMEGAVNRVLAGVGLGEWARPWLGDAGTVIPAIIFMGFPFIGGVNFLIYLAGLISVPASLHEAARLDGASPWQVFLRVELPLLMPQMRIVVLLGIVGTLHSYEHILVLTGGGPGYATLVPALYLFRHGFEWGNLGVASAVGVILFALGIGLSWLNLRLLRERP
jgi:ABC-type sugar transport system permease subunit